MQERPHSRYTRKKTWAALYTQHINAGFALLPHSTTNNSIDVIRCESPASARAAMKDLLEKKDKIEIYYDSEEYAKHQRPYGNAITAVVLAKSSDFYHYRLNDYAGIQLVICGQHDSYLQLPIWEVHTNKLYKPRETVLSIASLKLGKGALLEHNILAGALVCGDKAAIAYRDDKSKMSRWTRNRLINEVHDIQHKRYHGRPLAFQTEAKRQEIGNRISESLKQYHLTGIRKTKLRGRKR